MEDTATIDRRIEQPRETPAAVDDIVRRVWGEARTDTSVPRRIIGDTAVRSAGVVDTRAPPILLGPDTTGDAG